MTYHTYTTRTKGILRDHNVQVNIFLSIILTTEFLTTELNRLDKLDDSCQYFTYIVVLITQKYSQFLLVTILIK